MAGGDGSIVCLVELLLLGGRCLGIGGDMGCHIDILWKALLLTHGGETRSLGGVSQPLGRLWEGRVPAFIETCHS